MNKPENDALPGQRQLCYMPVFQQALETGRAKGMLFAIMERRTVKDFDFDQLCADIVAAAWEALQEVSTARPDEDLCGFALYSDSGAMTVCPSMCTTRFLATTLRESPDEYLVFKYSPSEWPLEGIGADEAFGDICRKVRTHLFDEIGDDREAFRAFRMCLMETCIRAQEQLRRTYSGVLPEDFLLLVTISDDDEPAEELLSRVRRLNVPGVADEFAAWTRTWNEP